MKEYIYEESNGLWYERRGDYYFPCLTAEESPERPIGTWGRRHLRFIKQHRKALYLELMMSGSLNAYLADIGQQAEEMLDRLIAQMAEREGVTEALKAQNQIQWVRRMNSIRHRTEEIILERIICQ